jgi:RNA-directed DNA polymerase
MRPSPRRELERGKTAMNEPGKSDKPVVPAKPANASEIMSFWELFELTKRVEGRGLAKENEEDAKDQIDQGVLLPVDPAKQVDRTRSREREGAAFPQDLHSALDRVRQAACRDKGLKFTSLWHHVYDIGRLREAYFALKRTAAAGVDGQTWEAYGKELESNLQNLSDRLARGAYRARPVKRVYIPKADGKQRPIGIPVLEDKIVQRAAVQVLNGVWETDFLGFSYGYRPGRSAHMALDALAVGIQTKKVSWLLDADIRGFFDTLDHEWLVKFVEPGTRLRVRGQTRRAAHPEMAERRRDGRRQTRGTGTRNAAGREHLAPAGQPLPALRV